MTEQAWKHCRVARETGPLRWWADVDSNHSPLRHDFTDRLLEPPALSTRIWYSAKDSNLHITPCKDVASPSSHPSIFAGLELHSVLFNSPSEGHPTLVERLGLEPSSVSLQG